MPRCDHPARRRFVDFIEKNAVIHVVGHVGELDGAGTGFERRSDPTACLESRYRVDRAVILTSAFRGRTKKRGVDED